MAMVYVALILGFSFLVGTGIATAVIISRLRSRRSQIDWDAPLAASRQPQIDWDAPSTAAGWDPDDEYRQRKAAERERQLAKREPKLRAVIRMFIIRDDGARIPLAHGATVPLGTTVELRG